MQKKSIKILLSCLVLTMALFVMTACGEDDDPLQTFKDAGKNLSKAESGTISADISGKVEVSGVSMDVSGSADIDFIGTISDKDKADDFQMKIDFKAKYLGQDLSGKVYYKDNYLYTDTQGVKAKQKVLLSDLMNKYNNSGTTQNTDAIVKLMPTLDDTYVKNISMESRDIHLEIDLKKYIEDFAKAVAKENNSSISTDDLEQMSIDNMVIDTTINTDMQFEKLKAVLGFAIDQGGNKGTVKITLDSTYSNLNSLDKIDFPDFKDFPEQNVTDNTALPL